MNTNLLKSLKSDHCHGSDIKLVTYLIDVKRKMHINEKYLYCAINDLSGWY